MSYQVPPDTSEKEKFVGGVLDLTQLIFVLIGLAIGLIIGFLFLKPIADMVGLVIGVIIGLAGGGVFAFLPMKGLPLHKYIILKNKHKKKTKKLPNTRIKGLDKEDINKIRNY